MSQTTLFDRPTGEAGKERGMALAADKRKEVLALAQEIAKFIARNRPDRHCNADLVQAELIRRGHQPGDLGNAAGSIFRGGCWEPLYMARSDRASNHARYIRIWRLKDGC